MVPRRRSMPSSPMATAKLAIKQPASTSQRPVAGRSSAQWRTGNCGSWFMPTRKAASPPISDHRTAPLHRPARQHRHDGTYHARTSHSAGCNYGAERRLRSPRYGDDRGGYASGQETLSPIAKHPRLSRPKAQPPVDRYAARASRECTRYLRLEVP
jgi:hypothetical protein